MPSILLLGAGFSRNWGGWLALEAFEYLLGCPQVDDDLRQLLWSHTRRGGFEGALAQLQADFAQRRDAFARQRLTKLQEAVSQMFADMDNAFGQITNFEPQNERAYLVRTCLVRFDAIFTLNQDLLLERHYLNGNVALASNRRWSDWQIPGTRVVAGESEANPDARRSPLDPSAFGVVENQQPYFKLHGSSNWIDNRTGEQLLVMGGDKASIIEQHPILSWNHACFAEDLSKPDTRLMVIGYSFGDDHVNRAITEAAERGRLRLFIIDPLGVEVLDKHRDHQIYSPGPLLSRLQPYVIGASRRTVREIFGGDRVEHGKVMRFFAPT